jgi:hypothetical protein
MRRRGSPQSVRKNMAGEYTQVGRIAKNISRSKLLSMFIIVATTATTRGHQLSGLHINI